MEPYDKVYWCFYNAITAYFNLLCIGIPKKEFSYNIGYFVILGLDFFAMYGLIYAMCNYDIGTAANALTLFLQGTRITVQALCVNDLMALSEIVKLIMTFYKDHAQDKIKRPLLIRYAFISELVLKCVLIIIGSLAGVYFVYPFGYYFYTGIRITPFPMYYPWWDENEDKVFYILSTFHEWEIFHAGVNLSAFFSLMTLIFINVLMLADMFGSSVLVFNESLVEASINTKAEFILLIKEYKNFAKYVS